MIYVVVHITKFYSPFPDTYTSLSEVKNTKQLRNFVSSDPCHTLIVISFPTADQNTDTLTSTAHSSSRPDTSTLCKLPSHHFSHCTPKCNKVRACLTERQHKAVPKSLLTNLCYLQKQQTESDKLQAHVP